MLSSLYSSSTTTLLYSTLLLSSPKQLLLFFATSTTSLLLLFTTSTSVFYQLLVLLSTNSTTSLLLLSTTSDCSICLSGSEDIKHMMFMCDRVKSVWQLLLFLGSSTCFFYQISPLLYFCHLSYPLCSRSSSCCFLPNLPSPLFLPYFLSSMFGKQQLLVFTPFPLLSPPLFC